MPSTVCHQPGFMTWGFAIRPRHAPETNQPPNGCKTSGTHPFLSSQQVTMEYVYATHAYAVDFVAKHPVATVNGFLTTAVLSLVAKIVF